MKRLRDMDPAAWNTGLSSENARICWQEAVDALETLDREPVVGTPPGKVLLIASANVFTVALPWMALLSWRGIGLRVKAARNLGAATRAMASVFEGVEVQEWRGGDETAFQQALEGISVVIAFGRQETMDALRARLPASVRLFPFGPRFSVGTTQRTAPEAAIDLARYDSRGCMSPAGWFCPSPDLKLLSDAMDAAETAWPRGPLSADEAASIRTRIRLAQMVGEVRVAENWAILKMPGRFFSPIALPRILQLYEEDPSEILAPHRSTLSTIATDGIALPCPRQCRPGEMQKPAANRWHDGVDVLAALYGAPFQEWTG